MITDQRTTKPILLSIPPGSGHPSQNGAQSLPLSPHQDQPLSSHGGLLRVVEYELADRQVVVQFGWPMSSWLDRLAVGVMVFNLMRLPRLFPSLSSTSATSGVPRSTRTVEGGR